MSAGAHLFHLILTILFFPWAIVWLCCAISAGNSRKSKQDRERQEELQLLRELVRKSK